MQEKDNNIIEFVRNVRPKNMLFMGENQWTLLLLTFSDIS